MNKTKIILPIAAMFMLVGCGPKTKQVKEIWGNTWGYVNSSAVSYKLEDQQKLEKLSDADINWQQTHISARDSEGSWEDQYFTETKYQKKEYLLKSEFIRDSDFPIFKENRDFFANNRIVVSNKDTHTVKVGGDEYHDASEQDVGEPTKEIVFNKKSDSSDFLYPSCDDEGYINELRVGVSKDDKKYVNSFYYYVTLTDTTTLTGEAYLELPALA